MRRLCPHAGLLALLTLLAFLAAACAGERPTLRSEGAEREVTSAASDADADESEETDDSVEADEVEDITLRLGVGADWTGDPADAGPASLSLRVVADLLHQGLTDLGADGSIGPGLADRWFVTEDRLTWTFVLPSGLTDGLGLALTARDVKLSLEGVAARGPVDQAATSLQPIRGWTDFMNGESGGVAGISAPDVTTLVIRLDEPFEMLPDVLAAPAFGITGLTEDNEIRTTGAYRYDGDMTLVAVADDAVVTEITLVRSESGPGDLLANDLVDWVVLSPGEASDGLPGDVIRQPLDLRVAMVVRLGDETARRALLGSIVAAELSTGIPSLNPLPNQLTGAAASDDLPESIVVDVPAGTLSTIGRAIEIQLLSLGVDVELRESEADEFAARVASGEAVFYPLAIAGGSGSADALLRVAGGVDDVTGAESDQLQELIEGVAAESDPARRRILIASLEDEMRDLGLMLLIGQFEVRVGIGPDFDGLRHRSDGTLDLSRLGGGS